MIHLLFAALVLQQAPGLTDAAAITREAQQAVEAGTEARLTAKWSDALTRRPDDRRARLALATLERLRYRYERADTLYRSVLHATPTPDQYTAAAHLGMALWRSLGSDIAGADSLLSQARVEAQAVGDSRVAFDASMSRSQLRARTTGPRVGLQLLREARQLLERPTAEDSAQLLCSEGSLLEQLGDTTGYARVQLGEQLARRVRALRVEGACSLIFAQIADRRGYLQAAAGNAAMAVRKFEGARYLPGVAVASQWLGYSRFVRGNFAMARADLERAVQAARATRFETVEAWAHSGLAELFFAFGDGEAARVEATRAATMHAAQGDLWGLANARRFEGLVLSAQGRLAESSARFAEAVAAYRRAGRAFNAVDALRHRALVDIRRGSLDSAQQSLDEATRLARTNGNAGWMNELPVHLSRLALARGDLRLTDSLVRVAAPRFDWRHGEASLVNLKFALYEAQFALRTQRIAVAESIATYAATTIAQWRQKAAHDDLRPGLAQLRESWGSLSEAYPPLVAGFTAAGRIGTAFQLIESVRARELTEARMQSIARMTDSTAASDELRRMSVAATSSIDDVRRSLQRDEALVSFTLGGEGTATTAIVVTTDTAFAVALPPREFLGPLIDRYARVAASGTEPVETGRQLGAALLTPFARELPAHVRRLLISPDGALFRVPFDALRLGDDRHAVQRFSISLVPSATVALGLRALRSPTGANRLLAIGDPTFARQREASASATAPSSRTTIVDHFATVSLTRLPRSADEASRVAQYGIQSEVLTRAVASESRVRRTDWRTIGVVHFATHALVDGEGQARTALALAPGGTDDGYLTPAEIALLRLSAPLIVLSACQTLGGQILGGEGLRGLTAPLFEAGARAIVVTHWSIGDRSVLPFVDRFYARMAAGDPVDEALRHAKLAAIRDGAHISDWAAFTVVGDGAMRPSLRPRRLSPIDWLRDRLQPLRDTTARSLAPVVSRQ